MAFALHTLILCYVIHKGLSCNVYTEREPESPFDEIARHPLGVCTGTHYWHDENEQQSAMYICSDDKSRIIKYTYAGSSNCKGDYTSSIASKDSNDFECDTSTNCPYVVVKTHNYIVSVIKGDEWRKWYSSSWVIDECSNGALYSCEDNTGYSVSTFDNANCDGSAIDTTSYPASEYVGDPKHQYRDIFCNQPDPVTTALKLPEDGSVFKEEMQAEAIQTAVCLRGRTDGNHREIANKMATYCFDGWDAQRKPVYKGEYAEIHWTKLAGSIGNAYGVFLYGTEDDPADGYPMAYCFADSQDVSVCSEHWYIEHGTSPRYYKDTNIKATECECTVSADKFKSAPQIGVIYTETEGGAASYGLYIVCLMGVIHVFL